MKTKIIFTILLSILILALTGCAVAPTSSPARDNMLNNDTRYIIEKASDQIIYIHFRERITAKNYEEMLDKQIAILNSAIISLSNQYTIQQVLPIQSQFSLIRSPVLVIVKEKK